MIPLTLTATDAQHLLTLGRARLQGPECLTTARAIYYWDATAQRYAREDDVRPVEPPPSPPADQSPTFFPVTARKSAGLSMQDKLFTSFHGRIPRAQWWLGSVLIFLSQVLLITLVKTAGGKVELIEGFISLLTLIPHLAIHIKRCHDRDRSGWFMLLTLIPLVNLWYIVEVGFLPGTKGDNRFGPDPLADKQHAAVYTTSQAQMPIQSHAELVRGRGATPVEPSRVKSWRRPPPAASVLGKSTSASEEKGIRELKSLSGSGRYGARGQEFGTHIRPDEAMFVPDRLKTNPYRVLGCSANATLSEIHKAAATMRRAALLGLTGPTGADIPLLGEIHRAEADIRTAIGRLENPVQRLSDRLFWFHLPPDSQDAKAPVHPTETIRGQSDGAVWNHDEALHGLFAAFESALDDAGVSLWVRALRAWHQVVSDDDYWVFTLALEKQGAFEPAALPSEIDALRDDAVRLAAEALVVAARDAFACNDTSAVRLILVALEELADTGPWAATAQEDIISPAVERFRTLCRDVREESGSIIIREQREDVPQLNKLLCDAALKRFRGEIEPALNSMIYLVSEDHEVAPQSREEAALCLSGIATDYTWAGEFIASEKLYEEALRLAHDTLGAIRIEDSLAQVRKAAHTQRMFGAPISSAPSLSTVNGFGFTLYGQSDYDPETHSYAMTHYFVALFVPIFPLGRYRVIDMGGSRYRFLGKLPLRKADRWHLCIAATAIVAMILIGVISSSQNSNSSPAPPTRRSAPSSQSAELSNLKDRIESGRSRIAILAPQLQPVLKELTSLNERIETLAAELKLLDEQHKAALQIDIADYNTKVKAHNALLSRRRALMVANSNDLQIYDDLVTQDSVLVKQYNALLR